MNTQMPETEGNIPVVCRVCQTRSYATAAQIGQDLICPDCHAINRVKAPQDVVPRTGPTHTGDEYRLADLHSPVPTPPKDLIKIVCGTCYTLMHARPEHVGKRVKCPDCGTITTVPRPPEKKPTFHPPDASDVLLAQVPPPLVDEMRKEIADRLLASATKDYEERQRNRPRPLKDPLRDGIYQFPFYANVIPLWVGATIAVLLDFALLEALIDIIRAGGYSSIMAAFLAPIVAIFTFSIIGTIAPHFLTIIEFTAEGYDKIPYWPSQDLLSRGRAMLFGINALAMSTMPGMLLVSSVRSLGVPLQFGLISTVLLLPLVVLSMAENDSVFAPFSKVVFSSVRRLYEPWSRFYSQVVLLTLAFIAIDFLVWSGLGQLNARAADIVGQLTGDSVLRTYFARTITVVSLLLFAIVYSRLIGRMAWILGQEEIDEEADEQARERVSERPLADDQ